MNAPTLPFDAAAALAWLATFLLHSSLGLGAAWVATRVLRAPRLRELVWRTALVGALVSATVSSATGGGPLALDTAALARWSHWPEGGSAMERRGAPLDLDLEGVERAGVAPRADAASAAERPEPMPPQDAPPGSESRVALSALALGAWLAWAAAGLARLFRRRRRLAAALAGRRRLRAGPLVDELRRLQAEHGPRRTVRLTSSPDVASPLAIGLSEICVPDYAARELGTASHAALLAHELAHLRRRDAAWSTLAAVLARLFPFQPLLRVAERGLRAEAELCCDADAVRATGDGAGLARCLLEVAERTVGAHAPDGSRRAPAWSAAMAAPPSELAARVEAALAGGAPAPARGWIAATAAAGAIAIGVLACAGPGFGRGTPGEDREPFVYHLRQDGAAWPESSFRYSLVPSRDPGDERATLKIWVEGELIHEERTDDPSAVRAALLTWIPGLAAPGDAQVAEPLRDLGDFGDLGGEEPEVAARSDPPAGGEAAPGRARAGPDVALRILEGGAIVSGGRVLLAEDDDDLSGLRAFLAEAAGGMPRVADPEHPDLPALPDGVLRIETTGKAPFARVLGVMDQCVAKDVLIWRLELAFERAGSDIVVIPYALPRDAGVSGEVRAPSFGIELRGEALALHVPAELGEGFFSRSQQLEVLRGMVQVLSSTYPRAAFVIDARPGTTVHQVHAVLDTVIQAGATNLSFVGRMK